MLAIHKNRNDNWLLQTDHMAVIKS